MKTLTILTLIALNDVFEEVMALLGAHDLHVQVDFLGDGSSLLDSCLAIIMTDNDIHGLENIFSTLGTFTDALSSLPDHLHLINIIKSLHKLITELEDLKEVLLAALEDRRTTLDGFLIHCQVICH